MLTLASLARVGLLAAVLAASAAAHAAGPQAKGQAPGWYRMPLGDFEVTALSDGTVALPWHQIVKAPPAKVQALLAQQYLKSPYETSVNGYLVNTGSKLVLIDAGAAGLFGPTLGRLVANLKASGYQPEQVDEVYITHLHGDHVGGLAAADGKAAFPNAVVRLDAREAGYWLDPKNADKAPAEAKSGFQGAQLSMKPYADAGRVKTFEATAAGVELLPGIRAIAARGHTPGHTIYALESQGARMVMWGDLMHVAAVQFPQPDLAVQFDSDSKAAVPQRRKAYADAAKKGYYVAVAHISFPGIGQLRPDGKGYRWLPAPYTSNLPPPPAPAGK